MLRRIVAMALLISFIAMASSGAMMFVIEKPSFTIQMHPVHKLFGIVMVIAAVAHMTLNFGSIKAHLRFRSALFMASLLTIVLIALYGAALNNTVPAELAKTMDEAASKAESRSHSK